MTQTDSQLSVVSQPLKERDERFARLYALGIPALEAARASGFKFNGTLEGNAANARKVAQRKRIRDRVAFWRNNRDAQVQAELRRIIESRLLLWHETDIGDFYEDREEPMLDPKGNPILDEYGHPVMRVVQRLRPFSEMSREQRRAIKSLTYTDRGRPNLELYSALDANRDLRKMNNFDAPVSPDEKDKDQQGDPLTTLAQTISDLANKLASIDENAG